MAFISCVAPIISRLWFLSLTRALFQVCNDLDSVKRNLILK